MKIINSEMSCNVCVENYNKSTRKQVTCNFCQFDCCTKCIQTYLLDSVNDPHCMSCKKEWDQEFIRGKMTRNFMNKTYKKHREDILFEREKSYLPETQDVVEREKFLVSEIERMTRELERLRRTKKVGSGEKRKFIQPCPANDCNGFLNNAWNCGICERKSCKDCHELKGENHTCDPNSLASVVEMKKNSKKCPSCGVPTFKISGCPQMFCMHCHTAWNWSTQRIETGIIHNPHYFQWQRDGGRQVARNPNDVICGGLYNAYEVRRKTRDNYIIRVRDMVDHWTYVRGRNNMTEYSPDETFELRKQFLRGHMTEEHFKKELQKIEKKTNVNRVYCAILTTFIDSVTTLIRDFMTNALNERDTRRNLESLVDYCKVEINKMNRAYEVSRHNNLCSRWN